MSTNVVVAEGTETPDAYATMYAEIMRTLGELAERVGALEAMMFSEIKDAADDVQDIVDDVIEDAVEAATEAQEAASIAQEAAVVSTIAAVEATEAADDVEEVSEEIVTGELTADDVIEMSEPSDVIMTEDTIAPTPTHFMFRPLGRRR